MSLGSIQNIAGELFPKGINWVWNPLTLDFEVMTQPVSLGSGGASAANQATEIARLEAIRDRLPPALGGAGGVKVEVVASSGGGLTDAELRATPVPVSGPLTDAQLRAVAVPISAAVLPLPAGASTGGKQDTGNASLASIDAKDFATQATLALVKTAVETIDNFIAGGRGLVTEDSAVAILAGVGAPADAEAAANGSTIAILKRLRALLAGGLPGALAGGRLDVNIGSSSGNVPVDMSDEDTRLLGRAKIMNTGGATIDPATEGTVATLATQATLALVKAKTDNVDILLSLLSREATAAKDTTVAQLDTDFKTATGAAETRPAAYTELDRLYQLGLKIDNQAKIGATEATMQKMLAAVSKPVAVTTRATLLHR